MRRFGKAGDKFRLYCPYTENTIAKQIRGYKWNAQEKCWEYPITYMHLCALEAIAQPFPNLLPFINEMKTQHELLKRIKTAQKIKGGFRFKTQPYHHQLVSMAFVLAAFGIYEGWNPMEVE